jgi:hypothetical protein
MKWKIKGKPEGPGIWLIDAYTAVRLVKDREDPNADIHNFIDRPGSGMMIGADWQAKEVVKFLKRPDLRIAIVFEPHCSMGHHLVALNDKQAWRFDIGKIDESRMEDKT